VITAPIGGKILSVAGTLGGQASANGSFIVLAGTNDVAIRAQFTEAEVAKLAVGQHAQISLPDRPGAQFSGTVIEIDPAGTISNRLVRYGALITFDQIPDGLLFGQSANVAVIIATATGVLYVPATAVTGRNGGTGTVVVRVGSKDVPRQVEIGVLGDVNTEIRSGLAAGDEVLTSGGG
jgi:multidrug efflux pump subunit AcrA (membrane-fusion protein)